MIDFNSPVRFRGIHAAYAQYLSTERGQPREGGVNIFSRIMDAYLFAILVGLRFERIASVDETEIITEDVFNNNDKSPINSSNIDVSTVRESNPLLNYIYKLVMLNETQRNLTDEEKIANAFKSEGNTEKIKENIDLMNKYARGGLEVMYERFAGLKDEKEIRKAQVELLNIISGIEFND